MRKVPEKGLNCVHVCDWGSWVGWLLEGGGDARVRDMACGEGEGGLPHPTWRYSFDGLRYPWLLLLLLALLLLLVVCVCVVWVFEKA
jgi:hypothetical protein